MTGQSNLVGLALAGRYKLIKMIGQGGMGSVYMGHDAQMSDRVVAVKVLAPHLVSDEKQVLRFEQEARAANQLRHPNTISVLDFGRSDGHIFMVIEYLTGDTLTNVLRQTPRLDPWRALYMMRQVCKSLAEAHAKGIIHRDLKPDNIFVCEIYGEKDFIKVIDFGIAKFLEQGGQELTQAGKMFGTPRYLSPEQAQGLPLTGASDLYALGVMLFEMLSGRPPFIAEDPIAVAIKHVQEPPPAFADIAPDVQMPAELDGLVFKLLAKKPLQRHQNAESVLEAIDSIMSGLGGRNSTGQYAPVANMTPARPKTIPPQSRRTGTVPPPTLSHEPEATRAMDSGDFAGLTSRDEPAPTMALDSMPHLAVASAERTMALDAGEAKAAMAAAAKTRAEDQRQGHKAKEAHVQASKPKESSGNAQKFLIVALIVVAVGAVVAATFLQGGEKTLPVALAPVAEVPPAPPIAPVKPVEVAKPVEVPKPVEVVKAGLPTPPPPKTDHVVTIHSTPEGASVTLDDMPVGKTPYVLALKLDGPDHKAVLKLDDFEDYKLDITTAKVAAAGLAELKVEMKRKAAKPPVAKGTGGKKPKLEW